jgi:hypothetical protein
MPPVKGKSVERSRLLACLRENGWSYRDRTPRREVYGKGGYADLLIPLNSRISADNVRPLLTFAGLEPEAIEHFLALCVGLGE